MAKITIELDTDKPDDLQVMEQFCKSLAPAVLAEALTAPTDNDGTPLPPREQGAQAEQAVRSAHEAVSAAFCVPAAYLSGAPSVPPPPEHRVPEPPRPPAAAPSAESVPSPGTNGPVSSGEDAPTDDSPVDKNGLPWDGRIHSETRSQNADGSWRRKRGVDPKLIESVEAELKGATPATPPAPPTPAAQAPAVVPPPPVAGTPATPPAPPAVKARGMADLSSAVAAGRIGLQDLQQVAASKGSPSVLELNSNPEALAAVVAHYEALGVWQ